MKKCLLRFTPIMLAVFLCSCIENNMLVNLNPDGSGTLTVRLLSSVGAMENTLSGLENSFQMAGITNAPDDENAQPQEDQSMLSEFKKALEDPSIFGEEITLKEIKDARNNQGWVGYIATYEFKDINKIKMMPSNVEGEDGAGSPAASMDVDTDIAYTFSFSQGERSTLQVIPQLKEEEPSEESTTSEDQANDLTESDTDEDPFAAAGLDDNSTSSDMSGMNDMAMNMQAMMMASMAPMLEGMRISYMIQINGDIEETNAQHRPKENSILVMDMRVDQLLTNPSNLEKLSTKKGLAELSKEGIEGLIIQNPEEPLTITFK